MSRTRRCVAGLSFAIGAWAGVFACSSDDIIYAPGRDSGADTGHDATLPPDDAGDAGTDAGDARPPEDAGDAGGDAGQTAWLLFSFGGASTSDLVAYNVASRAVDGTPITYSGFGTTYIDRSPSGAVLWNLEQQSDVVRKLDPIAPWQGGPSWNVRLDDRPDGGDDYADPVAVVSGPAGKAYVLRFNRNALAVIDPAAQGDASAPIKTIDLSRFVEGIDTDRRVDMAGAVYLPDRKRLYVLLGNIDLNKVDPSRFVLLCTAAKPRLVAIDVETDTVISPEADAGADAGDAGTGVFTVDGFNPVFNGLVYDAPRDRFLVLSGGCNEPSTDAGAGAVRRRQIDAIDPSTGRAETLLDLTARAYPVSRAQTDATHWALGFGSEAFLWDVTTRTLGPAIANAPQSFVFDGRQSLVGTARVNLPDGGSESIVLSTPLNGGDPTPLGPIPFTAPGQYVGGLDYWSP